MSRRPPDLAEWILERRLPPGPLRDSILGDLHEEFESRRERGGLRRRLATIWYWLQAFRLSRHFSHTWHRPDPDGGPAGAPRPEAKMNRWSRDTRYALNSLRRAPGFAALVILTLGLGIGANVAIFSVVDGVLLAPLSYPEPDALITIWGTSTRQQRHPVAAADYLDLTTKADLIDVTGHWSNTGSLTGEFEPQPVSVGWVDLAYFDVLGVRPLHGRLLREDDPNNAILLAHGLWQRQYGSDPDIVGDFVQLDAELFEVVGVLAAAPNPNVPSLGDTRESNDLFRLMPKEWYEGSDDRELGWIRLSARMHDGVGLAQVREQLDLISREARPLEADSSRPELWFAAEPLLDDLVGNVRPTLLALLGAVGFVLLIAAMNVAQLLLTRGRMRSGELAIRAAMGGGRADLFRQLVIEAGVLTLIGGAFGVGIGLAGVRALLAFAPANLPRLEMISVDGRVLGFALLVSSLAAVIAGIAPAVRSSRSGPADALKGRWSSGGRGYRRLTQGLVVAEVALSLVLLAGAGLLARSFVSLLQVHPGFVSDNLLTLSVTAADDPGVEGGPNFFTILRQEIEGMPGVAAVGGTNRIPLGGGLFTGNWANEQMDVDAEGKPESDFRWITPGYLRAMGTRLLAGRDLAEEDTEEVILVDEKMAAAAWPDESPIGKRLWTGQLGRNGEWSEVIGVVESMNHASVAAAARPTVFFNAVRPLSNRIYLAVRADGSPYSVIAAVEAAAHVVDPDATISRVTAMDDLIADANAPWRFALTLMALFAGAAMLITVIGLYGVIAYAVSQRRREIGIRVALGAPRLSVLRLVLGQTTALIAIGATLGVIGARSLTSVLSSLLYETSPSDPTTYAGVVLFMMLAGLVGAWRPTRRALRVDPREALGGE